MASLVYNTNAKCPLTTAAGLLEMKKTIEFVVVVVVGHCVVVVVIVV